LTERTFLYEFLEKIIFQGTVSSKQLLIIGKQLSIIGEWLSVIGEQLSIIGEWLSGNCY